METDVSSKCFFVYIFVWYLLLRLIVSPLMLYTALEVYHCILLYINAYAEYIFEVTCLYSVSALCYLFHPSIVVIEHL